MKQLEVVYAIEAEKLKPHPVNRNIYTDHKDEEFDKLIQQQGIQVPLKINKKNEILDGVRRWARAKKFNIKEVPCLIRQHEDEELAVVIYNKYRQKSPKEQYNEAQVLRKRYADDFPMGRPLKSRKKVFRKSKNFQEETGETTGGILGKVADELGMSSFKLWQIEYVYDNKDKVPQIADLLSREEISVNKAAQGAKLVLEEGFPEDKVIDKILERNLEPPRPRKAKNSTEAKPRKKSKSMSKGRLFQCPKCKQYMILDKKDRLIRYV